MASGNTLKVRGVWCNAQEAGKSRAEVEAFVERHHRAGINLIVVCVKGVGRLYWPSRLFPESVAEGYAEFDVPRALLEECRRRGMAVHAWFIDFMESADGPAFTAHPEWAMRNPEGGTTATEMLRGAAYHSVWMCPARRPGYTDQYLIPAMAEFAEMYDFDAIHHDYIRYPGDLAPDRYCFCDDCLQQIPRYAGYVSESHPNEAFFHETYDRPYIESHWEQSPRVLPANWERLPRAMQSRFLLEGSFFAGGRNDLDHFFYLYRTDATERFAREAAEAIGSARPGMAISAAVFKNPVQSGRFIGQDWRAFPPHVQIAMPMDYRDHYPGDFDTHLDLLAESIESQKGWARDYEALWPGICISFLFFEEERPLRRIAKLLKGEADRGEIEASLAQIAAHLGRHAPDLRDRIAGWLTHGTADDAPILAADITAFLRNAPKGYWPEEKLTRTIACVRDSGVEGICFFSTGLIDRCGMWDCITAALA